MFDIPRLYISACSNSVQLVPLHPIVISILFHDYKQLTQCISEVERIEAKIERYCCWLKKKKDGKPPQCYIIGWSYYYDFY